MSANEKGAPLESAASQGTPSKIQPHNTILWRKLQPMEAIQ